MKKARAAAVLLLMCSLLSGAVGGGAPTRAAFAAEAPKALVGDIPISFPLADAPKTLHIMASAYNGYRQEDVFVWQQYEKMTGVHVDWTTMTKETRTESIHNALTNGKSVDLILRGKLSAIRLTNYGKSGLILDLAKDGLLQHNAPNCWAYMQNHPDTLASVMNPDGTIYALPQVNSGPELRVAQKLYVNKHWLQRVNGKLPTTTKEFRDLLAAFRDQDANGNGDPDDEIPLCSQGWDSITTCLYGSFGLANRGFHNQLIDCDPATGGVRLIPASEPYRAFLAYMRDLYADGLLDEYVFSLPLDQWISHIADDKVGVFANTNLALLPADKVDDWVAIDEALTGPMGDKIWTAVRANFHSTGAAIIPATCADPALVLRWLDYFWTDEGTLFYHMGVEGETYAARDDGTYDYLPAIYKEMREKNLSFDDVVAKYTPYPGGNNPTVEIAPYFQGGEMAAVPAEAARKLFAYRPEEVWPSFTFTEKENDALDAVRSDISKYIDSMCIDFITGTRPLTEWNAYVAQLKRLGIDDMLAVYQAAADRFHALRTALDTF